MFTFIELEGFRKRRADLIEDDDFSAMQEALIVNPELGNVIQGTGGFRKLRWAREDTGKSGGVRIIYYNRSQVTGKLYLALIYAKNEADNITNDQKNQLKQVSEQLK
ncbi:MAG: type II toxin-antitoxin system RelE/ParE family toxin [Thalassolituus oleivorans]|nr:type II toxin-antitoxin system RelE/ParE family toxin [Thalassolituus oleivorans]